jgi:nucleotide-binding universal stress UspA family protein
MANPELANAEASSVGPEQAEVKLRKILVSTVYLETSATIDHALELAKLPGTQFVLLHIIETPRSERNLGAFASSEEYESKLEVQRQQALQHLESVCAKFRAAGAPCTPSARIGVPHEEILNEAAEIAADLIVAGSTATPALAVGTPGGKRTGKGFGKTGAAIAEARSTCSDNRTPDARARAWL